ncbi:GUN4 domain-containing protein [Chlorogloeopsis fritschii]|uniref:GUN4 domain-containing protein n=1 Tax=Chlorogloeopsis fritschii TaxID=1124 RepID=UPI0023F456A1|nr:GUN4 domain-containing protein [Chlorogloeopsis fritschii]
MSKGKLLNTKSRFEQNIQIVCVKEALNLGVAAVLVALYAQFKQLIVMLPQTTQSKVEPEQKQSVEFFLNCEKLDKLLELGKLKDADHETKRLLLELAGREKEGWLLPEDVKALFPQALSAIDQLWTKYSNGRFGFSVQSKIWRMLGCESSDSISTQTISENKFAQSVHWRVGSRWLSPWDSFNYGIEAPQGSLPREYIFALSGYWSYSKGWTGYFLLRFDEIFLKL